MACDVRDVDIRGIFLRERPPPTYSHLARRSSEVMASLPGGHYAPEPWIVKCNRKLLCPCTLLAWWSESSFEREGPRRGNPSRFRVSGVILV